ncbi:MAG: hypothetical protein KKD48_04300, partial [Nanoarchaeota archaeon]|nr:hypothetical protein [Nanoarchaeota archaeon]
IFLVLLIAGGVYYINFYHGKYNFKEVANLISVKLAKRRLFTNQQDMINLEKYVKTSLANNMKEDRIRLILTNKGWSKKQMDYAFAKLKK